MLDAIADQLPLHAQALRAQTVSACVVKRENSGAGFFTTLATTSDCPRIDGAKSPLGDIRSEVSGLEFGMGFLRWLEDGRLQTLEGYAYQEDTSDLDFARIAFSGLRPMAVELDL